MPSANEQTSARWRARWRWLSLLSLCLGLALTAFFGLRACHQLEYAERLDRGEIRVETLRGWMTLPYIEQAYGPPEAVQRSTLGLPAQGHEDRSLREWFDTSGIDPLAGRRLIESLILERNRPGLPPKVEGAEP